jgi:voltage-gated sodium channel
MAPQGLDSKVSFCCEADEEEEDEEEEDEDQPPQQAKPAWNKTKASERVSAKVRTQPPRGKYDEIRERVKGSFVWNASVSFIAIANMLAIGLEVDFGCMHGEKCRGKSWQQVDILICAVFVIEIAGRIALDGPTNYFRGDRLVNKFGIHIGNCIDLMLVSLRVVALVVDAAGTPTVIKMITVIRIVNVAAAMRAFNMRALRELNLILVSLGDTFKAVGWVFAVLTLVSYVFAIIMTEAIGKNKSLTKKLSYAQFSPWTVDDYWGSVPKSLYTLLQVMTLDQWSSHVVRPIIRKEPALILPFVIFLCISVVCLLNLITGVVVESTLSSARVRAEREAVEQQEICEKVMNSLEDIFQESDEDGSGEIDRKELQGMLRNPRVRDRLKMLDIPLKDFDNLFSLLDDQGSGSVPIGKYFRGASRLRGQATACDLYHMSVDLSRHVSTCDRLVSKVDQNNDVLARLLDDVDIVDRDIIRGDGDDKDPVLKARKNRKAQLSRSDRLRGRVTTFAEEFDEGSSQGDVDDDRKETNQTLRFAGAITDHGEHHSNAIVQYGSRQPPPPARPGNNRAIADADPDEYYGQRWVEIPSTGRRCLEDKPQAFRH